jgi:ATP adenylyltransferase
MNFEDYEDFIQRRMRMAHIYQPVMLIALLEGDGTASKRQIARAIPDRDESQIEYYEKRVIAFGQPLLKSPLGWSGASRCY